MSARCAFIQAHRGEHPIRRLCQVLGVSRAGYYAWHTRQQQGPRPRAQADEVLAQRIAEVHAASRARYGSPVIPSGALRPRAYCAPASLLLTNHR